MSFLLQWNLSMLLYFSFILPKILILIITQSVFLNQDILLKFQIEPFQKQSVGGTIYFNRHFKLWIHNNFVDFLHYPLCTKSIYSFLFVLPTSMGKTRIWVSEIKTTVRVNIIIIFRTHVSPWSWMEECTIHEILSS